MWCQTNVIVTHSKALRKQQSLSQSHSTLAISGYHNVYLIIAGSFPTCVCSRYFCVNNGLFNLQQVLVSWRWHRQLRSSSLTLGMQHCWDWPNIFAHRILPMSDTVFTAFRLFLLSNRHQILKRGHTFRSAPFCQITQRILISRCHTSTVLWVRCNLYLYRVCHSAENLSTSIL